MDDTVRELTRRIASGDAEAFTAFFRAWFDRMYAWARRVTGRDESFCLDVVQDAMLRVIRSLKPMGDDRRLRGWLYACVQRCAYDRLRSEARRRRREQSVEPAADARGRELDDRLEWLRQELSGLPEPRARMLVLRYRLGWTLERIGEALGMKTGAVDGRIGRSLKQLRHRAEETFHE